MMNSSKGGGEVQSVSPSVFSAPSINGPSSPASLPLTQFTASPFAQPGVRPQAFDLSNQPQLAQTPTPGPQISQPTEQVAFNSPEWHRQNRNYHNEGSHTIWRATPLDQRNAGASQAPSPLPAPGPTRYQQMAQAINQRSLARGGR